MAYVSKDYISGARLTLTFRKTVGQLWPRVSPDAIPPRERKVLGWDPRSESNLLYWFDARWNNGLDAEPTAFNSTIAQWNDLGPNGWHVTQSTENRKPTRVSSNGVPAISFDGSRFMNKSSGASATGAFTAYIVCTIPAPGTGIFFSHGQTYGYGVGIGVTNADNSGSNLIGLNNYYTWIDSGKTYTSNEMTCVSYRPTNTIGLGWWTTTCAGSLGNPEGPLVIGANTATPARPFTGKIHSLIAYNEWHDYETQYRIRYYLGRDWGGLWIPR